MLPWDRVEIGKHVHLPRIAKENTLFFVKSKVFVYIHVLPPGEMCTMDGMSGLSWGTICTTLAVSC